jgi:very-short-patch-repair endonuclease
MREERARSDQVVAKIAGRQHGVVSAAQLGPAGIDKDAVTRRVRACRIHRIHRGVYAVGHTRLTFEGRCMAAVLVDRSHSLIAGVTTRRKGIAVTKPARTLQDLRRTVPQPVYRRAVRRALDLRLIRSDQVSEPDLTRSELERLFLGIWRRHRLPQPEVNARLGPYEVDFLWRDRALVVETDSWRHHGDRTAFERDRARDAHLQRLGFRVLRFTHRQLIHDRSAVVAALRGLLSQRSLAPNL